ncbi:hypothetical protein HPB47_002873, partial [Ixodes persulcatus]
HSSSKKRLRKSESPLLAKFNELLQTTISPSPSVSNHPPPRRDSAVSRASRTAGQGQLSHDHRRSVSPKRSHESPNS